MNGINFQIPKLGSNCISMNELIEKLSDTTFNQRIKIFKSGNHLVAELEDKSLRKKSTPISIKEKGALAQGLEQTIVGDIKKIIENNIYNVENIETNLKKLSKSLVRNTTPDQTKAIQDCFNKAIDSLTLAKELKEKEIARLMTTSSNLLGAAGFISGIFFLGVIDKIITNVGILKYPDSDSNYSNLFTALVAMSVARIIIKKIVSIAAVQNRMVAMQDRTVAVQNRVITVQNRIAAVCDRIDAAITGWLQRLPSKIGKFGFAGALAGVGAGVISEIVYFNKPTISTFHTGVFHVSAFYGMITAVTLRELFERSGLGSTIRKALKVQNSNNPSIVERKTS